MPRPFPRFNTLVALLLIATPASAYAQRFVQGAVSVGGGIGSTGNSRLGGWYLDAMKSLVPDTALVADVSALYGTEHEPAGRETWVDVFAGLRQRVVRRDAANVFGQFLVGKFRYSQSFSPCVSRGCQPFTNAFWTAGIKTGIGVDVPIDSHWSARMRVDFRVGTRGGEAAGGWSGGGGISRFWGER
jgi:hypothetical protein